MTVSLDHVTRTIDGVAAIRDVSLTLEAGGKAVKEGVTKDEAAKLRKQLEDQGATVEVK